MSNVAGVLLGGVEDLAGELVKTLVHTVGPEWLARTVVGLFADKTALQAVIDAEYAAVEKAAELAEREAFKEGA